MLSGLKYGEAGVGVEFGGRLTVPYLSMDPLTKVGFIPGFWFIVLLLRLYMYSLLAVLHSQLHAYSVPSTLY